MELDDAGACEIPEANSRAIHIAVDWMPRKSAAAHAAVVDYRGSVAHARTVHVLRFIPFPRVRRSRSRPATGAKKPRGWRYRGSSRSSRGIRSNSRIRRGPEPISRAFHREYLSRGTVRRVGTVENSVVADTLRLGFPVSTFAAGTADLAGFVTAGRGNRGNGGMEDQGSFSFDDLPGFEVLRRKPADYWNSKNRTLFVTETFRSG